MAKRTTPKGGKPLAKRGVTPKAAATKASAATARPKPKPKAAAAPRTQHPVVNAAAGEQAFVLKVPFEERQAASWGGARFHTGYGWVYVGKSLPASLKRFEAPVYSWEAYIEADLAGAGPGSRAATLDNGDFTLRPDQIEDRNTVLRAFKAGAPEVLIGSDTGVGKTVTAIAALKAMPAQNILVIAPLSVVANWRLHLKGMGDGGKRWALINYDSAKNLLHKPPLRLSPKTGKPTQSSPATLNRDWARRGLPRVAWDIVVTDESHLLSNPMAQRTSAIERVIAGPAGSRPALSLRLTATAGADPSKLAYLHRGLAYSAGERPQATMEAAEYAAWCADRGIKVKVDKFDKLKWTSNSRDLDVMHKMIYGTGPTNWALRRVPDGWPVQQRNRVPIEFDGLQRDAYEEAWEEFLNAMAELGLTRASSGKRRRPQSAADAGRRKMAARAAQVRYRQKAGLLRAAQTVDFISTLLDNDLQVAVNCEFRGTVEAINDGLHARKIDAALYLGGDTQREEQRLAFQRGANQVILFTPPEGFSLHANESAVGGTATPRALVVAEPRWAPTPALQIEGRTQRNGEAALAYYPFAVDTIEERVIRRVITGMANVKKINGDDTASLEALGAEMGIIIHDEAGPLAA